MKLIQTLWLPNNENIINARCGFLSPRINIMSWALSSVLLNKYYNDVELYTNKKIFDLFSDLGMPYTNIICLDESEFLRELNPKMWAFSKIYTYSLQREPFIHIDGDFFLYDDVKLDFGNAEIIVQNIEQNLTIYKRSINALESISGAYIPQWLDNYKEYPMAYNMGVFGSKNIDFVQTYCNNAFEYYSLNKDKINSLSNLDKNINIIPEQLLLYSLATKENKKVKCICKEPIISDYGYNAFCNIYTPHEIGFVHCLGGLKQITLIDEFIEYSLKSENKELWERIDRLFGTHYHLHDSKIASQNTIEITSTAINAHNKSNEVLSSIIEDLENVNTFQKKQTYKNIGYDLFKPFASYRNKVEVSDLLFLRDTFIIANPNHSIIGANYDYNKIIRNDFLLSSKNSSNYLLYSLKYSTSEEGAERYIWFTLKQLFLFEKIKTSQPTLSALVDEVKSNEQKLFLIEIIQSWLNCGLVSISKVKRHDLMSQNSKAFIDINDKCNLHVIKMLEYYVCLKDLNVDINKVDRNIKQYSIFEIVKVLKDIGLKVIPLKCPFEKLRKVVCPFISVVNIWEELHIYVVVLAVLEDKILIYNPITNRKEEYSIDLFVDYWEKNIIVEYID